MRLAEPPTSQLSRVRPHHWRPLATTGDPHLLSHCAPGQKCPANVPPMSPQVSPPLTVSRPSEPSYTANRVPGCSKNKKIEAYSVFIMLLLHCALCNVLGLYPSEFNDKITCVSPTLDNDAMARVSLCRRPLGANTADIKGAWVNSIKHVSLVALTPRLPSLYSTCTQSHLILILDFNSAKY